MKLEGQYQEQVPAAVQALANQIMTALEKAYPSFVDENKNHCWNLKIDTHGGVIQLTNTLISGKMGVQLPVAWLDPEMKVIVRYAGELLERYRISREKRIDVVNEIENMERNALGEAVYDT